MLSRNQIREIQSLKNAKFRKQFRLFIAEGPRLVFDLLNSRFKVHSIYTTMDGKGLFDNVGSHIPTPAVITQKELERISLLKTPNKVLALFRMEDMNRQPPYDPDDLILILDGISDPGNMGTIVRTADWFGVKHIVCSENCVEMYNPKVVQATMGSLARVQVYYTNIENYVCKLSGKIDVFGAVMDGKDLYSLDLPQQAAVIIGNESHGISQSLQKNLNHSISIPSFSEGAGGQAESLNASIAAAIICSEFRRKSSNR